MYQVNIVSIDLPPGLADNFDEDDRSTWPWLQNQAQGHASAAQNNQRNNNYHN